MLEIQP